MGIITIQSETTKDPISLIGREAGVCWGTDVSQADKNYERGMDCILANHGRTLEYPQVYMVLDGYSARVMREFYTHIAGGPTRLQASTRYINYQNDLERDMIIPPSVLRNEVATNIYKHTVQNLAADMTTLNSLGIPKEDIAMLLPLGMATKVVVRTNLRHLIDMSHQRLCTRAYWEYRQLMQDMITALSDYSNEWKTVVQKTFHPKCEVSGNCTEKHSCGRIRI